MPDDTPCDDSDLCTQTDTCQAGICTGADLVVCTPLDTCHDAGVCDPATGSCSNPEKADGIECDDGDLCTQEDICQAGVCMGADPVVCTAPDQCHQAGTCDPDTGDCSHPPLPDGSVCTDEDICTQTDTCQAGVCTGTDWMDCDDGDDCTSDTCHQLWGCQHEETDCGCNCHTGAGAGSAGLAWLLAMGLMFITRPRRFRRDRKGRAESD
jgi:MYXO-CTERM domain-containing protein